MKPNWELLRRDFPIVKKCIYLDHASGGPIPLPVHREIQKYYEEHAEKADFAWTDWIRRREEVRRKVARFIHAEPEEITFIQSTSQGMNHIAELLAKEGAVLTNDSEFPSSTLPWIWRKAKIIWQKSENYQVPLEKLKSLLAPSVKIILTSFVQYATGFRQDMEALGKLKGSRYLVVNATQGFGAFPINVRKWDVDFLVTNSYKWLMAGYGGGILYLRKRWLKKFRPLSVGWRSMNNPEAMNHQKIDLKPDASRYEMGCPSFPTVFGVGAAIDYLSGIGTEIIEKRILELTDYLMEGLENRGLEVVSPKEKRHRSGIVTFKASQPRKLWKRLLGKGIYASPRGAGIRVAPHFYNTTQEVDQLLRALEPRI